MSTSLQGISAADLPARESRRGDAAIVTLRSRWAPIAMTVTVLGIQVAIAAASISILSAVRAYVGGESLYSKGQKEAKMALYDYMADHREEDFTRFQAAWSVPAGDGRALHALLQAHPDEATAQDGFLAGGNDPKDIPGLIWLFRNFGSSSLLQPSIRLWTQGDDDISELGRIGEAAHASVRSGAAPAELNLLRGRAVEIDRRLGILEQSFSAGLADASRDADRWLLALNIIAGGMLGAASISLQRRRLMERSAAEQKIRYQKNQLQQLLDSTAEGIVGAGPDGVCTFHNRRALEILGHPEWSDLIGDNVRNWFVGKTATGSHPFDEAVTTGLFMQLERIDFRRVNGSDVPVSCWCRPVGSGRQPEGVVLTFFDISDQLRAQDLIREEREARLAVEAASKAKTSFLSRMSHELRTPLNAVLGFVRLMIMDKGAQLRDVDLARLEHIENAGNHLLALVNDVLDLSRVELGQVSLSLESVDVAAVASEALIVAAQLSGEKGPVVRPVRVTNGTRAIAHADRVRLRQVFINLLSNSVKYSPAGGQVEMAISEAGEDIEIKISDTGQGMTEAQMKHLFEPFNRLGAEHSSIEGTGIGLMLSRHLMLLMNGHLEIRSVPGEGTTATVVLKRAQAEAAPADSPEAASPSPAQDAATIDVLYAEDNELNVELFRQVVELAPNVALRIASNGRQALEMARERPPRLMLVDMQLGDMTGHELAKTLRSDRRTAGIRLVAISADAMPEQIDAALRNGFEEYLTKPINVFHVLRVFAAYGAAAGSAK